MSKGLRRHKHLEENAKGDLVRCKSKDGVINRKVFHDKWFVESCNKCNYWNAGFDN